MKPQIHFHSLQTTDSQRVDVTCSIRTVDDHERVESHHLSFEFDRPIPIRSRNVALALSTLCGRAYSHITYDFEVDAAAIRSIETFTQAQVSALIVSGSDPWRDSGKGHLLSFSGGFDSMAAMAIMPSDTRLVSLDFGDRFSRERKFFETFDTLRVSTNLVRTPFRANSWLFMAIGSILANPYYNCNFHTFGTILEAGEDGMSVKPVSVSRPNDLPLSLAGLDNAPYVAGLTEIGTLLVVSRYFPDLLTRSLLSLASPGEEKLYRKSVLAQAVLDRVGIDADIPDISPPARPHFAFGDVFALDFLIVYLSKYVDRNTIDRMLRDVPDSVIEFSRKKELTFYERLNTTHFSSLPASLRASAYERLQAAGIELYTESDWLEYAQVRYLLRPNHSGIRF